MDATTTGFPAIAPIQDRPVRSFGANSVVHRRTVGSREIIEQSFSRQLGVGVEAQGLSGEIEMGSTTLSPGDAMPITRKAMDDSGI